MTQPLALFEARYVNWLLLFDSHRQCPAAMLVNHRMQVARVCSPLGSQRNVIPRMTSISRGVLGCSALAGAEKRKAGTGAADVPPADMPSDVSCSEIELTTSTSNQLVQSPQSVVS